MSFHFTKHSLFIYLFLIIIAGGCKNSSKPDVPSATSAAPTVAEDGPEIPGIPEEVMVRLLNECTYVDYIFHTLPFSLSQSEDPSIDQNIYYIDFKNPVKRIPKDCKPIGRKFFHIKGEIEYDVDVYLTTHCKFYVFVDKKNKPMYANYMTETAVKFYANIAQQARGATGQPH